MTNRKGISLDPPVNGERGEGEEEEGGGEDGDDSDNGGDDGSDDGDDDGEIEEEAPLACVIFLGSETEDDVMLVCGCEFAAGTAVHIAFHAHEYSSEFHSRELLCCLVDCAVLRRDLVQQMGSHRVRFSVSSCTDHDSYGVLFGPCIRVSESDTCCQE